MQVKVKLDRIVIFHSIILAIFLKPSSAKQEKCTHALLTLIILGSRLDWSFFWAGLFYVIYFRLSSRFTTRRKSLRCLTRSPTARARQSCTCCTSSSAPKISSEEFKITCRSVLNSALSSSLNSFISSYPNYDKITVNMKKY